MRLKLLLLLSILALSLTCAFSQNVNWAFGTGGALDESQAFNMPCVHVDNAGNIYHGGVFESVVIDVDPSAGVTNIANSGAKDGYFAKYTPSGNLIWAVKVGGALNDGLNGIGTDANGNVYITGFFNGTVDFDPSAAAYYLTATGVGQTLSGDVYLAKYTSSGQLLWAFSFGSGTSYDYGHNLTVTPGGVVYLYGVMTMTGNIDVDPSSGSYYLNESNGNAFCVKYNTHGKFMSAINLGGVHQNSCVRDVKLDKEDIYLGGYIKGSCDINPGPGVQMINSNSEDAFIMKLDTNFNFQWGFSLRKDNTVDEGCSISLDQNNIYFSGYALGTNIDFDPSTSTALLSSAGSTDNFIASYTKQGQYRWAKLIGGSGAEWNASNTCQNGNVILCGYFNNTVDFNPSPGGAFYLTSKGAKDGYCLMLDTNGVFQCAFQVGGTGDDHIHSAWVYAPGKILINGTFHNNVGMPDGSTNTLTSNGGYDLFLADMDWVCGCNISYNITAANTSCKTVQFQSVYVEGETATHYVWYFGDGTSPVAGTSPTHIYNTPGTYTVSMVATGASGCKDSIAQTVLVNGPNYTILSAQINCGLVYLSAVNNGGTVAATTSWYFGDGSQASGVSVAHLYSPGLYTVSLVVTDAQGCSDTVYQSINIPVPPPFAVTPVQANFCQYDAIPLAATGGVNYQWYPAVGISNPYSANPVVYPSSSTVYHVIITNACGVIDTLDVALNLQPSPDVDFTDTAVACGAIKFESFNTGAAPAASYQWFFGDGFSSASQNPTHGYLHLGTYNVLLIGTSAGGCRDSVTHPVDVEGPNYYILPSIGACGQVILSAISAPGTIAKTIDWQLGDGTSASGPFVIHTYEPGSHVVQMIVIDSLGCTAIVLDTIEIEPIPPFSITPAQTDFCMYDTVALHATGGGSYQWYPMTNISDPYTADPIVYPGASTTYTVIITNTCNVSDTLDVELNLRPSPQIMVTKTGDINCSKPATTITASGCSTYAWMPSPHLQILNSATQTVAPNGNASFTVIGYNEYGCSDTGYIDVAFKREGEAPIYAPTAFSPDGNGHNDCWRVYVNSNVRNSYLAVFNRWGEKVFETNDFNNCWDGTSKGNAQPMDTYFYQYKIGTVSCGDYTGKGEVTLIR